jgi:hypothetical protein
MLQQGKRSGADEAHGRLEAADDQQRDHADHLVLAEPVSGLLGLDQRRHHVVPRLRSALRDQAVQVAHALPQRGRGAREVQQRAGAARCDALRPAFEAAPVLLGDPQHVGDDGQRQLQCETADQLQSPRPCRRVQQLVADGLDAARQPLDGARCERLAHERAQADVVRRVGVKQVPVERLEAFRYPAHLRPGEIVRERTFLQDEDGVVVAGHQPGAEPERQPRTEDGRLGAQARVERIGIGLERRAREVGSLEAFHQAGAVRRTCSASASTSSAKPAMSAATAA